MKYLAGDAVPASREDIIAGKAMDMAMVGKASRPTVMVSVPRQVAHVLETQGFLKII